MSDSLSAANNKKCMILGITAGIAVYKAADLCSKLTQQGYEVLPVMTPNACKLISPRIFFTLAKNSVLTDVFEDQEWKPKHVALSERADLLLVAPCTANFMGKFAHGIADDALTTTALAHGGKPVLLAPAMNHWMWKHQAVQDNYRILQERGVHFVGPETGYLACGTEGDGRMSEVPKILEAVKKILN